MTETNLNGQTLDIVAENVKKLKQLFPEIVTEDKIDFARLQDVLGNYIERNDESYKFSWYGKSDAFRKSQVPSTGTLRPSKKITYTDEKGNTIEQEDSKNWDTTQNLYIEGDNLEVLKLLGKSYVGKVKMIYIDPPYNKDKDFVYPDKWSDPIKEYKRITGQLDEDGNTTTSEEETEGGRHTRWLNMMYPRLRLASNLLTDDGVIFISIDDDEVANLKRLCNDVFGEENFVGTLVLQTATDNNPRQINTEHEYMLCYGKSKSSLSYWQAKSLKAEMIYNKYIEFKNRYNTNEEIQSNLRKWIKSNANLLEGVTHYDNVDDKGVFHDGDVANTVFGGYEYEIIHPITKRVCKIPDKGFRFPENTLRAMIDAEDIMFGNDETILMKPKKRLENAKDVLRSIIYEDGRTSTKKFEQLMSRDIFQNPKSETILKRLLNFILNDDDIVIDFFSGSGTIAEATMLLNCENNKQCRFVLVQLPESLEKLLISADNKAKKTIKNSIEFLNDIKRPLIISEIGKERIRRAGESIKAELKQKYDAYMQKQQSLIPNEEPAPMNPDDLDIGFKVFKLDTSNLKRWSVDVGEDFYTKTKEEQNAILSERLGFEVNNFVEGRSELDMVYEIMLKYGLDLSYPVDTYTFNDKNVYSIGMGALLICLDDSLNKELASDIVGLVNELEPTSVRVVVKDLSFINDSEKTNFKEDLKTGVNLYFAKENNKANKENQFEFITI